MKNIQLIDSARNSTYQIYQVTDDEFALMFPSGTDVVFLEDIEDRLTEEQQAKLFEALWSRPVSKKAVQGIHGSYFLNFSLSIYFPTRMETEVLNHGPAIFKAESQWKAAMAKRLETRDEDSD